MSTSLSKVHSAQHPLSRSKGGIHARAVSGRFNTLRWALVWLTQALFYGGCWLTWTHEGVSRQAVLLDIAHERLYFFGLVLWPQDALWLAVLLIAAATGLFLATALAGRIFCGFACPQTVYTAIFAWVEARIEGDHRARRRLDEAPPSARKWALRTTKHVLWLLIAAWTGVTFVGYFSPVREWLPRLPGWQVGPWEGFWLLFYTAFTYVQAGLARESVCQHMCPYSRFQGVMIDEATCNVAYDSERGEPRKPRGAGRAAGACIDCGLCVQVCPTGIDIREGLQYPCINCGLCIDACDAVMRRVRAPVGLIRFASVQTLGGRAPADSRRPRLRVAVYAGLLVATGAAGIWLLATRPSLRVDVLRDRGALLNERADGRIENHYTLKLANLADAPRELAVVVEGWPGLAVVGPARFPVMGQSLLPVGVTVSSLPGSGRAGIQPIRFRVFEPGRPEEAVVEDSRFALPRAPS